MEISGVNIQISGQYSCGIHRKSYLNSKNSITSFRKRFSGGVLSSSSSSTSLLSVAAATSNSTSGFCDNSHLEYYSTDNNAAAATAEKMKKKEKKNLKKKMKLIKGLSKNLSEFSDMGFGLVPDTAADSSGLADQFKGKMISEAAEILGVQLKQLREEEMELKKKKKEEKAKLKAAKMMQKGMSSSSSSSESSDSECGEMEIVDLKKKSSHLPLVSNTVLEQQKQHQEVVTNVEKASAFCSAEMVRVGERVERMVFEQPSKKIEVCMGGKCKKSGAGLLLEEFQNKASVLDEGVAVVGCKCMGKCRDGPNVKLVDSSESGSRNSLLCIGVGLEDVNSIVTNFISTSTSGSGGDGDGNQPLLVPEFEFGLGFGLGLPLPAAAPAAATAAS